MTWSEQRRSEAWKRKKTEVFTDSEHMCDECQESEHLTVHHGYYAPRAAVWEYPMETLWTLCVDCHRKLQEQQFRLQVFIGTMHPNQYSAALHALEAVATDWGRKSEDFDIDAEVNKVIARLPSRPKGFWDYSVTLQCNSDLGAPRTGEVIGRLKTTYPKLAVEIEEVNVGPQLIVGFVSGPVGEIVDEIRSSADSAIESCG